MRTEEWINYHTKSGLFLNSTKRLIHLKEVVTEPIKTEQINLHRFYHANEMIGCMLSACGYDRGPKREQYIYDLLAIVDGCYSNPPNNKRNLNMEHFQVYVNKAKEKFEKILVKLNQLDD